MTTAAPARTAHALTLVDLLRLRGSDCPDAVAYTFVAESDERSLSYGELDRRARAIAGWLQSRDVTAPVLLIYPAGLEFVAALCGTLYAGVVAVPAPIPEREQEIERFFGVLADSGAALILTTQQTLARLDRSRVGLARSAAVTWHVTDVCDHDAMRAWKPPSVNPASVAYLQYTSGSTGIPKGIAITHGNVLHNLASIEDAFRHTRDSVSVTWLPHFHDMGLVYGILAPLYARFRAVLMAPAAFLQSPMSWLQVISRCRATHSGGPNFAFDLCVRRAQYDTLADLDLETWTVAFNGAERIRAETIDRFADLFGICGFRRSSFFPAYGLAESTLEVSCKANRAAIVVRHLSARDLARHRIVSAEADDPEAYAVVSCGAVARGTTVAVVRPDTCVECAPDEVGEIWISGPSVADGYWRRPKETRHTFKAHLPSSDGEFLRTGDLGFVDRGELFVTGRIKDLIIVRGRNYYPEDIESTVSSCHEALRPGAGAAFSVDVDGEERLVVVQEVRRGWKQDLRPVHDLVRSAVAAAHDLQVHELLLVKAATVPKTSSGKIQRHVCRRQFLEGRLAPLISGTASSDVAEPRSPSAESPDPTARLRDEAARILRVDPGTLDVTQRLTALGLDSLAASDLVWMVERNWGVTLPAADLLSGMSLRDLAARVRDGQSSVPAVPAPERRSGAIAPLTVEQERLWLMEQLAPRPGCYNIATAIRFHGRIQLPALDRCLVELVARHDALQASFGSRNGQPVQRFSRSAVLRLSVMDDTVLTGDDLQAAIDRERDAPFTLGVAPLVRATLFRTAEDEHVLVLVAHHIIADAQSLSLLKSEIAAAYEAHASGQPFSPDPAGLRFSDFAWRHRDYVRTPAFHADLRFWRAQLAGPLPRLEWPSRTDREPPAQIRSGRCSLSLPEALTAKLADRCRREDVTPFMWTLAAFTLLLSRYTGQHDVLVGSPVSGRSRAETSRLVGFLAHPTVFRTRIDRDWSFRDLLAYTRALALQVYPRSEMPFAKLVEVASPASHGRRAPLVQAMLSFVKADDAIVSLPDVTLSMLDLPPGETDFELCVTLVDGRGGLRGYLQYNGDCFDADAAARLAQSFSQLLEQTLAAPDRAVRNYELDEDASQPSSAAAPATVVVASTFEARPIDESLRFWLRQLHMGHAVEIAPANQVMQQLLDPRSNLAANRSGFNVVLARLDELQQSLDQFCRALRTASDRATVPFIVVCCPPSPTVRDSWNGSLSLDTIEATVKATLEALGDVLVVTSAELLRAYPVERLYDPYSDTAANVPYTQLFFTALGTMIARKMYALSRARRKVIVLDCDHTLWKGVCSEDGALGVAVDPPRRALQAFMLEQYRAGMLLCLCSKNDEESVALVFQQRQDLLVSRDHFVATRINWRPKSENLASIAQELGLGLDSFILVDDDAAECAEVQANCPDVVTVQLPRDDSLIETFLRHVWAFDHVKVTREDRMRSRMYGAHAARERSRGGFQTLQDFIDSLELVVRTREAAPDDVERLAQLTQRTNHFNTTMKRRTARDIARLQAAGCICLVTDARDRFGDYGTVGGFIANAAADLLSVDTFVLSCRALGKGVERHMVRTLIDVAAERSLRRIEFSFVETARNTMARSFLERLTASARQTSADGTVFTVDVKSVTEAV